MTSAEERNAEIWSTRVQRELLALTTDNVDPDSDMQQVLLPPFIRVRDHALDISKATCVIAFELDLSKPGSSTTDSESNKIVVVVVQLDASLPKKSDGRIDGLALSYPFAAPTATLVSGAQHFPPGSTVDNGDLLAMDLDWTPSLHFTDAITNIGLKVKESILQGETFHPAGERSSSSRSYYPQYNDPVRSARLFASSFTKKASKSLTKAFGSSSTPAAPAGMATTTTTTTTTSAPGGHSNRRAPDPPRGGGGGVTMARPKKKTGVQPTGSRGTAAAPTTRKGSLLPTEVKIGDEINILTEEFMNQSRGLYSCKAIRRPKFVADAMAIANERAEQQAFSSPTAMFRSLTQSARAVLEECFLMVTESHIIELKTSKLNQSIGTVVFAISIDLMAKLKFRRQESLSLFFKPAPDDPLIYMCPDASDAVHQIQTVLKRHGVRGKHTNAAAYRAISEAMHLVQEIQTKELALNHDPTVDRVNEIMDLYRQAAERFEVAGDIRHEEVVTHMRKFLALPLTTSILDGSFKKPPQSIPLRGSTKEGETPEGEVLERAAALLSEDDVDAPLTKEQEMAKDRAFEENMDNLLKEAQEDLKKFRLNDPPVGAATNLAGSGSTVATAPDYFSEDDTDAGLVDVAADLDAMMREADKELAELMRS